MVSGAAGISSSCRKSINRVVAGEASKLAVKGITDVKIAS